MEYGETGGKIKPLVGISLLAWLETDYGRQAVKLVTSNDIKSIIRAKGIRPNAESNPAFYL